MDVTRPAFMADANCHGIPSALFFPLTRTGNPDPDGVYRVLPMCRACPVQRSCLLYGYEHGEHGIWGGVYLDVLRQFAEDEQRRINLRLYKKRRATTVTTTVVMIASRSRVYRWEVRHSNVLGEHAPECQTCGTQWYVISLDIEMEHYVCLRCGEELTGMPKKEWGTVRK